MKCIRTKIGINGVIIIIVPQNNHCLVEINLNQKNCENWNNVKSHINSAVMTSYTWKRNNSMMLDDEY
jgi:hypothetical protein